jgi:redox-sensitive bicupin YhaK (pirin superfamily)
MSGPVRESDASATPDAGRAGPPVVEVTDDRAATVGALPVRRALPRRGRRTVGAWCFADHLGPADVTGDAGIAPHPHTGLATVTWLLDGELRHRDSLGSDQAIRPGELNLMTAGHGVSHSEESAERRAGRLEGVQLWVAQPGGARLGEAAFEHHAALPEAAYDGCAATVLVGELGGTASPARHDTPLVGADVTLSGPGGGSLPLRADWEYAVLPLRGAVGVEGRVVAPGQLAYLGLGRDELGLDPVEGAARVLLLGGEPFEPVVMWWNFVARSREEMIEACRAWEGESDRFGPVESHLGRIPAPPPLWDRPGMQPPEK